MSYVTSSLKNIIPNNGMIAHFLISLRVECEFTKNILFLVT